ISPCFAASDLLQIPPSSCRFLGFSQTVIRPLRCFMQRAIFRAMALVLISSILAAGFAKAQVVTTGGIVVPTLKQQLQTGLLARTPDEIAFVDKVVAKVNAGELPISLVQTTFLWARAKGVRYPMPYFERALRIRAAAVGIDI